MEAHHDRFALLAAQPVIETARLAEGALLVATSVEPEIDIDHELARMQALSDGCEATDPAALALELFGSGRFAGNTANYYDARNSVLPQVIDRGLGIPITLAVVFIDIGHRRGMNIDGVGMPGHFLTRSGERFFDPFHGGMELDEAGCGELYARMAGRPVSLPRRALDPTPPTQILQRMLWNLRSIAEGKGDNAMRFGVLGMLAQFAETPLPVKMAWASALAERGQFGQAATVAEAAKSVAPATAADRLQAMADRWSARLN